MILISVHGRPRPDPVPEVRTPRPTVTEQSRLADQTSPSPMIQVQTRSAYRTLSNPHALATSCSVSTCRQVSL